MTGRARGQSHAPWHPLRERAPPGSCPTRRGCSRGSNLGCRACHDSRSVCREQRSCRRGRGGAAAEEWAAGGQWEMAQGCRVAANHKKVRVRHTGGAQTHRRRRAIPRRTPSLNPCIAAFHALDSSRVASRRLVERAAA
eukprot:354866-Chlamydomonas_euryale.AAC.7